MSVLQYLAMIAILLCAIYFFTLLVKLIKMGMIKDYSKPSGSVYGGVLYSNTVAMLPQHKESAKLHIFSYIAGIFFHAGIFFSLFLLFCSFFDNFFLFLYNFYQLHALFIVILFVTSIAGIALFIKRIINNELRELSNLDDFLSNFFVTLFQIATMSYLLANTVAFYYVVTIILFLYMPSGKLKHPLYYFFARLNLGYYFGQRNVWGFKKRS